jgi:2-phosphoglycerate kinase
VAGVTANEESPVPTRAARSLPLAFAPGAARPERHEKTADVAALRERLRHVFWIGGGSGAGKSTIGRRIAARRGLRLYATDDVMSDHAHRSAPEDCPFLSEFAAMDMDERWVNRSPETMLETFHWFRGEGFDLIVEDLLHLPREPCVIVEGFRLLPHLVMPFLAVPGQAVWLLPTPDFRRAAFDSRGSLWEIARKTSDPERALRNLLERDRMFTERLCEEAKRLGLRIIEVDTTMTEDDLTERVTEALGL